MLALRYAALLAIVIWVGGLVALGAMAAPSVFDVMAARHVPDGRLLAGAVFGDTLRRFHLITYGCGVLLLVSLVARAALGPRPAHAAIRLAVSLLMLAATLYSGIVLTSRIEALQQAIGVAPSSLPETDPRRLAFNRLHGESSAIQLLPLAGGLLLLMFEMKD